MARDHWGVTMTQFRGINRCRQSRARNKKGGRERKPGDGNENVSSYFLFRRDAICVNSTGKWIRPKKVVVDGWKIDSIPTHIHGIKNAIFFYNRPMYFPFQETTEKNHPQHSFFHSLAHARIIHVRAIFRGFFSEIEKRFSLWGGEK